MGLGLVSLNREQDQPILVGVVLMDPPALVGSSRLNAATSELCDESLPHGLDFRSFDGALVIIGGGNEEFKPILCRPPPASSRSRHGRLLAASRGDSLSA